MIKQAWNESDTHTLRNLVLGGALIGGGAGAMTSWVSQLRALKQQAERDEELRRSTIPLRLLRAAPENEAEPEAGQVKTAGAVSGGLGLAGGVVAGTLSYQLARKLYEMFNRRETAQRLTDAQEGYEQELLNTMVKQPGHTKRAFDTVDTTPGFGRTLAWLTAAGIPLTAYVAHLASRRVLDKAFPASDFAENIADEMGGRPVRVDTVRLAPKPKQEEPSEEEDAAQKREDAALMKTAGVAEHLVGMLFAAPLLHAAMPEAQRTKSASWGWVKVAAHRPEVLQDMAFNTSMRDVEALAESAPEPDTRQSVLANALLLKHAGLGTQYGVLVAADLAELMPMSYSEALEASPELADRAVKTAAAMGADILSLALDEAVQASEDVGLIKDAMLNTGGTVPEGGPDVVALRALLKQMGSRKKKPLIPKAEHTQEAEQREEGKG